MCDNSSRLYAGWGEKEKCEMLCCQFCWQSVRAQKRSALPGGKSHYDKSNCDKSCPQQLPLPSLHTGWNLSGNWVVTWKKGLEASMAGELVISWLSVLTSNRSVSWPVRKHACLKKREREKKTQPFFDLRAAVDLSDILYHRPHPLACQFTV